ncbi:hypothetical protein Dimus_032108 [Dionaea muscipula]
MHTHGRQPPSSSNGDKKRGIVEHESRGRRWIVLEVDDDRHIPPELDQIRSVYSIKVKPVSRSKLEIPPFDNSRMQLWIRVTKEWKFKYYSWLINLKWLNRMTTVKLDGTVQFDVPRDIKPHVLDFGSGHTYGDLSGMEQIDSAEMPDFPPLQIVMLIVGTRGDVQPFVAIGKRLQDYGHRGVRLATHSNFKEFVLTSGLEFFP